jgi:hypothetical protein
MARERAARVAAATLEKDPHWRGWEFWTVTVIGGYDPTVVARDWSAVDVHDCYWDLALRGVLS